MSVFDRAVAGRTVGQLPVSISTSLAFESAFGIHPELTHPKPPILDVDLILVNVRTLIRNINGAIDGDIKHSVDAESFHMAILEEMQILEAAVQQMSNGACTVGFYACSLNGLRDRFPGANLKLPSGTLQEIYASREIAILKLLAKSTPSIALFNVGIEKNYPVRTLLVTHHPVDLLDSDRFRSVSLLETHTGAIKAKTKWNTKLTNGKMLIRIPFNKITIQIFGDNNNNITQMPAKVRQSVLDMAEKNKWTVLTTKDKIIFDAGYHKDPLMKVLINGLK